jgi:cysteine-rich repeat protein
MRYGIRSALITITAGMLLGSGPALAASTACKADLNGDLVVNFGDLAVLKSVFFQRCSDPGPRCGDGIVQAPEQCDDGNVWNADGCSSTCAIEVPHPVACGNGIAQGPTEQCDDGNLVNADGCSDTCMIEGQLPRICGDGLAVTPEQCDDGNLANGDGCSSRCTIERPVAGGSFPATGQTTCWNSVGSVILCAGTGQDGDVQAGASLAYVEHEDGTITDTNTGLMWEKLSDDRSIHDWNNVYTWDDAFSVKIAALNAGRFAGYRDWRLPNIKELQSIVNYEIGASGPAVAAAFNTGCTPGCTVTSCSCTQSNNYWSSSSYAIIPSNAWNVFFYDGISSHLISKTAGTDYVRAVRGGP